MATVKKTIGRLPVYKGDWVAGSYSMLNQVSYLGSTFQSKIDNNTSQPATVVNNALQVNANWTVVSNGTAAYLADERLSAVEDKNARLETDSAKTEVKTMTEVNAESIIDFYVNPEISHRMEIADASGITYIWLCVSKDGSNYRDIVRNTNPVVIKLSKEDIEQSRTYIRLYISTSTRVEPINIIHTVLPVGIPTNETVIKDATTVITPIVEKQSIVNNIRPSLSISSDASSKATFNLDFINKKLIMPSQTLYIFDSQRLIVQKIINSDIETAFVSDYGAGQIAILVWNIRDEKLYYIGYGHFGEYPEYDANGNRINLILGTLTRTADKGWCFNFGFSHIQVDGEDFYQNKNAPIINIEKPELNIGLSPFRKFGTVGDSLTVGEWHEVVEGGSSVTYKRCIEDSWGRSIARKYGNTCLNFGFAGATTASFMSSETNGFNELALANNKCQAYIIAIGTNDTVSIGNINDIDWTDSSNNANSFYGNYAKIVQRIRLFAPKSIIFCTTIPHPRNSIEKNNAIRAIANNAALEGVFLVDLAGDKYNNLFASNDLMGYYFEGHYNAAGYALYGSIVSKAVSDTLHDNNTNKFVLNISGIPFGDNNIIS